MIAILDTNGDPVARYAYDAWGKVLSVTDKDGNAITDANHVANINPIRYRGYYYDTETGWYYLNSRYYDPSVKRFLNADGIVGANGNFTGMNLFAYCNNNPVMGSDPSGCAGDYIIATPKVDPVVWDSIINSTIISESKLSSAWYCGSFYSGDYQVYQFGIVMMV